MSGTNKVIQSAIQKKGGNNSALVSALDNANVEAEKLEGKEKKDNKK